MLDWLCNLKAETVNMPHVQYSEDYRGHSNPIPVIFSANTMEKYRQCILLAPEFQRNTPFFVMLDKQLLSNNLHPSQELNENKELNDQVATLKKAVLDLQADGQRREEKYRTLMSRYQDKVLQVPAVEQPKKRMGWF